LEIVERRQRRAVRGNDAKLVWKRESEEMPYFKCPCGTLELQEVIE